MIRIAFIGKAGAGKDFAADLLEANDPTGVFRIAFADEVKRIARMLFPKQYEAAGKPRKLLQDVGDTLRDIDPNVWINATMRHVRDAEGHPDHYLTIITDVRYQNEYDRLKAEGFTFIRIVASPEVCAKRMQKRDGSIDIEALRHKTELTADAFEADYTITNIDDDPAALFYNLTAILRLIEGDRIERLR